MQVLYRLGYSWPLTTWKYVEKFIDMLQRLASSPSEIVAKKIYPLASVGVFFQRCNKIL